MSTIAQTLSAKVQPVSRKIKPLTKAQRKLIGRLLVEVLEGALTEETRKEICALNVRTLPVPFHHLVSFVQGSSMSNEETAFELSKDVYHFAEKVYKRYLGRKEKP